MPSKLNALKYGLLEVVGRQDNFSYIIIHFIYISLVILFPISIAKNKIKELATNRDERVLEYWQGLKIGNASQAQNKASQWDNRNLKFAGSLHHVI